MRTDRIAALGVVVLSLAAPTAAHAFCRTTTTPVPPDFQPGASGACFTQGAPLYHPSQCVTYRLVAKESSVVPNATLSDTLTRAFSTWTAPNATCLPGITVLEVAPIDTTVIAHYEKGASNANVIGIYPGKWPHGDTAETLGLTTLTFDVPSGAILDADMEINGEVGWSATKTVPQDGFDLESALVHEAGHFLGLAHAALPEAIMFASYTPGSAKRALSNDDAFGVCSIYPSKNVRVTGSGSVASTPCNLAPGDGSCGDPKVTHGCAATPTSSKEAPAWWALVLGVTALGAVFSRRRRFS